MKIFDRYRSSERTAGVLFPNKGKCHGYAVGFSMAMITHKGMRHAALAAKGRATLGESNAASLKQNDSTLTER